MDNVENQCIIRLCTNYCYCKNIGSDIGPPAVLYISVANILADPIIGTPLISSELAGKNVFSTLDLKDRYWQIELDKDSSLLYTFASPLEDTESPECLLEYLLPVKSSKRRMKQCFKVYQVFTLLLMI